jgi:hypothetical protein
MAELQAGWRINIKGRTSKEDIAAEIINVLSALEASGGIQEYGGINLYVQLYRNGKKVAVMRGNRILGGSTATSKQEHVVADANDNTVVRFDTTVDYARLQQKVNTKKMYGFEQCVFVDLEDINKQVQKVNDERQKKQQEQDRLDAVKRAEQRALEKQSKDRHSAFKLFLIDRLGISQKEFPQRVSSFGELKSLPGKLNYLEPNHPSVSGRVWRVTLLPTIGVPKTLEIYDENHTLVKVIDCSVA